MTSVEGHGSTFTLYLPSANENSREKPVGTIQTTPKATKLPPTVTNEFQGCGDLPMAIPDDRAQITPEDRTLLIIEDDLSFAKIIMEFVREHGFLPIVAGDGESGIALANYYLPDAILLDAMLPEMDGWEVISNLKKNNLTKHIPVHFMTCLEDDKRAFNLGAIGFITKPVSQDQMNDVFRTIENTLDNLDRRLLIVEDDDNQAASLHALLSSPKIQVEIAKDVKTAIEFLNNNHVDCIVLDLGLNDISNLSLLSQIQQLKSHKNTPIIIHSGRDISHEQEKEMKKFAQSIIVKGAKSQERLLDEVTLFLHMVGKNLNSEKQPDTSESMQSETSLTGKKVLLVDDDMRNIFSLTSLLDALEIVVIEAENGLEALTRLNEHTDIKLVLMDIMMPEMDGYEAMRHIRQHRTYNNIPIIAMTAKAMTDDKQKCLDAGASDYISKPIDTQKLISTMRVWIAKEQ